ncbi:MAG: cupin domain-containing protein [Ferruginibacter sp.]
MKKINIKEKLSLFTDHWNPRIIGELNGQHVKLAKFSGEFIWHSHEKEDELFMVIKGNFNMEMRDKTITLNEGDILIVPRGTEHRPVASEEVHILLFEPVSTINTGNERNERTRAEPEII